MCKTAFVYSDKYLDYCPERHPYWNLARFSIIFELVKALGWINHPSIQIHNPHEASIEDLQTFHHKAYINKVMEFSEKGSGQDYSVGLGPGDNPIFKGVHDASSLIAGGSIQLVDLVEKGQVEHGFTFLGGLHHAVSARASGFCYYNDAVLAIKRMQKLGYKKILYLDTDCHHGDGTQEAFYNTDQVLTISLHESGRFLFPGTGFVNEKGVGKGEGYSVNVPLMPYTTDELWWRAFEEIVPPLWNAFEPDFIYWQCGTDTHYQDPLTRLKLTNNLYRDVALKVHELTHQMVEGRLVLGGGGGYSPVETAKAWTIILAIITEIEVPEEVPQEWIDYCQKNWGIDADSSFFDPQVVLDGKEKEIIDQLTNEVIKEVKETIFSHHGL